MNTGTFVRTLLLLFVFLPYAAAQTADGKWRKAQDLPKQSQIRLRSFDGHEYRGKLDFIDDNKIGITQDGQGISKLRQELASVEILTPSRRLRNIAIGAAIGFAAGAVGAFATCPSCVGEQSSDDLNTRIGLGGLIGASAGAAVGAAGSPYETVYKARKP